MKKTLITLLALLAAPVMAEETKYDFDLTISTPAKTNQGNYYGFTVALGLNAYVTTTMGDQAITLLNEDITSYTLNSLSILTRDNNTLSPVKIAVYAYEGDSNVGSFVGLSNAPDSVSNNANVAFTFNESITLTKDAKYQFLFVDKDTTVADLTTLEGEATLLSNYQEKAVSLGIAVTNSFTSNIPSGWGTYKGNGINSWEGQYVPVVSFASTVTTQYNYVPEPATATLSLLALAGLAARRRRASH